MKVLIAFVFAIGSVAAAGSGPYLPSGWKPEGPAFYLPSEMQKQSDNPLKETLFQESEASGSDALREYGPPKLAESPLQVTNQGLPDVITEQAFLVEANSALDGVLQSIVVEETSGVEVNADQSSAVTEAITLTESEEAVPEDRTTVSDAPTTEAILEVNEFEVQPTIEASILEVQPTFDARVTEIQPTIDASILEVQPTFDATLTEVQSTIDASFEVQPTLEANVFEIQPTLEGRALDIEQVEVKSAEDVIETTANVGEFVPVVVEEVVQGNVAGVKNIADALEKLEKEIKAVEVEAIEGVTEVKLTQETSGSLEQGPKGFLEYGPPGFREYGPPKEEDLLRSALVQAVATDALDNNEVRRRRFSPKFRSSKKAH